MRRHLLLLLALSAATPLAAQFDTTTLASRIIQRRMTALEEDPTVKELIASGTFTYPDDLGPESLARLDDQTVLLLSRLLGRSMGRASSAECALLLGETSNEETFLLMVNGVEDSLEAEDWATLLERMIWAEVEQRSASPMAAADEVVQVIVRLMLRAEGKERDFIMKVSQQSNSGCLLSPWMMDRLGGKSPQRAAYLIRGLLAFGSTPGE